MDTQAIGRILGPRFERVAEDGARALAALGLPPDTEILDAGTGSGNFAIFLASQGYRVLTGEPATDHSHYAGRDWASGAKKAGVLDRIAFQAFDAGEMPFESGRFDAVFFYGVLHHVAEDSRGRVLREALRVANPSGAVVFFEPRAALLEQLRVDDPSHPPAANPSQYLSEAGVRVERIAGAYMDIYLFRKGPEAIRYIDREEVARRLTYDVCIPIVRDAMIAFSRGETRQLLRSILPLPEGRLFGVMPGAMGDGPFGAKLISIFPENTGQGRQSHQGLVVLFEPETGAPVCIVHAGEITAIRTAAASAVATAALARPDAHRMAIIGCGEQAGTHLRAIAKVRILDSVVVWGRSAERARDFVERSRIPGITISTAETVEEAVAEADIICTVTGASEPVLRGAWVRAGTHVNVVGSSHAGPSEIDSDLVVRSRFIVDSREGILQQGAEFLRAREAGLIGDDHIAGEIGQVLAGEVAGRRSADEITVYKSIGHIVQDLATAWALYSRPEQRP